MSIIKQDTYILDESHNGQRLDKVLALLCAELSRTRIKNLILDGFVSIDNTSATSASQKVYANQEVSISIPESEEDIPLPEDIPVNVVFEDTDIIVLNKPAGMVVHPAPGNRNGTLVNALLYHCKDDLSGIGGVKRPGIVHRLDKETSGLMVVAKNDMAHQALSAQFADRTLSRRYKAFVWGVPAQMVGTIDANIARSRYDRKKMATVGEDAGKPARTHYQVEGIFQRVAALVDCKLESGRTHQIRVHMAALGHGVIGDVVYGKLPRGVSPQIKRDVHQILGSGERHALHAHHLQLVHPLSKEELLFTCPLPEDLQNLAEYLQNLQNKT
jgi:23S rRNA pseudouridine1911/1915/1917 synthase